jgi:penicillin-binding protein 2A
MGGSDPSKPGDPSGTTPAPAGDPVVVASADTTGGQAGQGDPLPTGNADSNLDNSGNIGGGSGGDMVGSGGSDNLGSGGGGGDVGGDTGGGGGEYGTHTTCRAVSCSVSAKACICKHY